MTLFTSCILAFLQPCPQLCEFSFSSLFKNSINRNTYLLSCSPAQLSPVLGVAFATPWPVPISFLVLNPVCSGLKIVVPSCRCGNPDSHRDSVALCGNLCPLW